MAPTLNTLLTLVLLVSSPKTTLASPPASIGSLLCAGTLVFVFCFLFLFVTLLCEGTLGFFVGTGAGMGLGYLVFGWRFRNSIGIWKGDQGFGIWGRKKREAGAGEEK